MIRIYTYLGLHRILARWHPSNRRIGSATGGTSKNSKSPNETAKDLAELFEIDPAKGLEIAKLMSQSSRREMARLRGKLVSGHEKEISVKEPSPRDLRIHALTQGIPFIGFGIMDNAILIWAGDKIDTHLGVVLGISTLCAAAIGNIISDLAGVGLGAYIEDFCSRRLRLPKLNLSTAQRNLRSVRFAGQSGNAIGLTLGCIIGMFPLLFIDVETVQLKKQDAKIDAIFHDVITETNSLIGAQSTCLFLVVDGETSTLPSHHTTRDPSVKGRYLYAKYTYGKNDNAVLYVPLELGRGIVARAATSGKILNIDDALNHPDYDKDLSVIGPLHEGDKGKQIKMLCVPVIDVHGNTIAVIQAANRSEDLPSGFSDKDEKVLQALAAHVSVTLQNMHLEGETSLKEIIKILKEHGTSALS